MTIDDIYTLLEQTNIYLSQIVGNTEILGKMFLVTVVIWFLWVFIGEFIKPIVEDY